MTTVQYYRRVMAFPAMVFLITAIPAAFLLPRYAVIGLLAVAVGAAFGGGREGASEFLTDWFAPLGYGLLFSPAFVAYLILLPLALWRIWRRPETAYRRRFARFPLEVATASILVTALVVLPVGAELWQGALLGVIVAVPAALAGYLYRAVSLGLLSLLRALSRIEPQDGPPPSSRWVSGSAAVGGACGLVILVAAVVGMSRISSDQEKPAGDAGLPEAAREATAESTASSDPEASEMSAEADPASRRPANAAASAKLLGTLTHVDGSTLVILGSGPVPLVGATADLSKRVALPGTAAKVWIQIARVRIARTDGLRTELDVIEQKTRIQVSGREHDHFTPGSEVRLAW